MISGRTFLVKTKDEVVVYKPVPNTEFFEEVLFLDNVLYAAIEGDNCIAVIDRNHKNCTFNKEQFNKHFDIKIN